MNLSDETIDAIVGDLECGFICYIHKKKDKYFKILDVDFDEYYDATDEDLTKTKEYKKLKKKGHKYIAIKPSNSNEGYKIMSNFVDTLQDEHAHTKFSEILNRRHPFSNFKNNLAIYGLLDNWYAFKTSQLRVYLIEKIEMEQE